MSDLQSLLERVEATREPSRVLDFDLHIALVADENWPVTDRQGRVTNPDARMSDYLATYRDVIDADDQDFDFPRYTASLDAALALAERVFGNAGEVPVHAVDVLQDALTEMFERGWKPNQPTAPQLAHYTLAAMLRALISKDGTAERSDLAREDPQHPTRSTEPGE